MKKLILTGLILVATQANAATEILACFCTYTVGGKDLINYEIMVAYISGDGIPKATTLAFGSGNSLEINKDNCITAIKRLEDNKFCPSTNQLN